MPQAASTGEAKHRVVIIIYKLYEIMEKELNIAKILKDKQKGTKLYADAFGELSLECVNNIGISTITKAGSFRNFYNNGKYSEHGEPILVPSKEMHDWSKFSWKKGDILVSKGDKTLHAIFGGFEDDTYTTFKGKHFFCDYVDNEMYNEEEYNGYKKEVSLRTIEFDKDNKDDAQTYINTIEEKLGGKLNRETLEIEKQPEFKDGDILYITDRIVSCNFIMIYKNQEGDRIYHYATLPEDNLVIMTKRGFLSDNGGLSKRYATEEEKQRLFEAIAKEGKCWNAEKKIIEDAKKEHQFKPFDKVLARDSKDSLWHIDLYEGMLRDDNEYNYRCMAADWVYCIPYEGNEHLSGTTKDVEE